MTPVGSLSRSAGGFFSSPLSERQVLYLVRTRVCLSAQAYRTVSKKFHPDKMAAAEAAGGAVPQRPPGFRNMKNEEFFMEIKKAQEVLMSDVRRSNYDRFGDHNYGTNSYAVVDSVCAIVLVALKFPSFELPVNS